MLYIYISHNFKKFQRFIEKTNIIFSAFIELSQDTLTSTVKFFKKLLIFHIYIYAYINLIQSVYLECYFYITICKFVSILILKSFHSFKH